MTVSEREEALRLKICNLCGVEKAISEFGAKLSNKSGITARCRVCISKVNAKHYEKNHHTGSTNYRSNPVAQRAKSALQLAVRAGKVQKLPCIICGEKKSLGHHPDYSARLSVVWLCSKHHAEAHAVTRRIQEAQHEQR